MKQFGIILLTGLVFLIFSCEKTEYAKAEPQLEFIVIDENLTFVENANIFLYETVDDWRERTNEVEIMKTGTDGKALFKNLKESLYFFHIEKGKLNNYMDIGATKDSLRFGQKSLVTVILKETEF